jgi:hypothetical protein
MFGAAFLLLSDLERVVIWTVLFWTGFYGLTYYSNMMILRLFRKRPKDAERVRPSLAGYLLILKNLTNRLGTVRAWKWIREMYLSRVGY